MTAQHPGLAPGHPHALDREAYADGTTRPHRLLALETEDPFWRTLGGSAADPYGDNGETFRQRRQAMALGIGANIYGQGGKHD